MTRWPRRLGIAAAWAFMAASGAACGQSSGLPSSGANPPSASQAGGKPPIGARRSVIADNRIYLDHTDHLRLEENGIATLTGHVRVRYRAYTLTSDQAVVDPATGVAVFSGHVVLDSSATGLHVAGDDPATTLAIDMRRGTYILHGTESAKIPPAATSSAGLLLPIYFEGGELDGRPDLIDARDADLTTCDFLPPHYYLQARTWKIRPGKRLVARHVSLFRLGRRVITVPLLVIPLDNRSQSESYIPEFGEDSKEGYFAKFSIPYALTGEQTGLLHLDYMSRMGVGYGFDQDYSPPFSAPGSKGNTGLLKFYYLPDRQTGDTEITSSIEQKQTILDGFQETLNAQYQSNSYQLSTSNSTAFNGTLDLNRTNKAGSTDYSINYQSTNYGYGPTDTTTQSFTQQWNTFHNGLVKIQLGMTTSTTDSSGVSTDLSTLTTATTFMTKTGGYQWQLAINKNAVLANSTGGAYTTSVEKLPELSIETDSSNMKDKSVVLRLFPFLTAAGAIFGDYNDRSADAKTERADFTLNMDNKVQKFRSLNTTYGADFQQDFYGDNAARYVLTGNYGENYSLGKDSHFQVTYKYERQYGYTPFIFDEAPNTNNASATLAMQQGKAIGVNLVTGFDFTRATEKNGIAAAPWQNLSTQLVLRPNSVFANAASPVWNLNNGKLVSYNDDIKVTTHWGLTYLSTVVYDPNENIVSSVTGDLTLPIITDKHEKAGYSLRLLDGYNGYTKSLSYYGADLTRSWHDYELSAIVENNLNNVSNGSVFYLVFRLKALPAYEPFGVAKFGQGVSTGTGTVF